MAEFPVLYSRSLLLFYFKYSNMYMSVPNSQFIPLLPLPFGNHKFVFCVCESVSYFKRQIPGKRSVMVSIVSPVQQRTVVKESCFLWEYQAVSALTHLVHIGLTPNQSWDNHWIIQYLPSSWTNQLGGEKLCDRSQHSQKQLWKKGSISARFKAGRMKGWVYLCHHKARNCLRL